MTPLAIPFPGFDPVLIHIGPLAIRWYALAYITGILLGWQIAKRLVRRPRWLMTPEHVDDLVFYATLGIILGGRLGYVLFYHPLYFAGHPLEIFAVWQGGMSFHGGLTGVIVGMIVFAWKHKLPFFEVADVAAVATPPGLLFGRIANFINGELWGRPTNVPWAVIFPRAGDVPRHPSQIYEAGLEGVLLGTVMLLLAFRPRRPEMRGFLSGVFLVGYALARSTVEFFREPDAHLGVLPIGLTMGQLLSLPMLLFGLFLILRARARVRAPEPAA